MEAKKGVAEALSLLERAVEEKGADYVYPDSEKKPGVHSQKMICAYKRADGGPSCIVGHVAHYEGFLDEMVEGRSAVQHAAGARFDPDALGVLDMAQSVQDGGETWGEALKAARAEAP